MIQRNQPFVETVSGESVLAPERDHDAQDERCACARVAPDPAHWSFSKTNQTRASSVAADLTLPICLNHLPKPYAQAICPQRLSEPSPRATSSSRRAVLANLSPMAAAIVEMPRPSWLVIRVPARDRTLSVFE